MLWIFVAITTVTAFGCGANDSGKAGSGGATASSAGGTTNLGGTAAVGTSNGGSVNTGGGGATGGSTSGSGTSSDCPEGVSVMCGMVAAHNSVRAAAPSANPALPPMTWDATLAAFAQNYASTCPAGHNPNRTVEGQTAGENMYFTSQPNPVPPAQVVQGWASEQANYVYPANTCGGVAYTSATFSCATCPECGHYTQIVWRTTIKVGCGVATACSGSFPQVWVCDYLPAGNVVDRSGNLQLPY
jgi:hypothetical protein